MEARAARIVRSRTGCLTCRRRKKKCDEKKPVCAGCKRNRFDCSWPAHLASTPSRQRELPLFVTASTTPFTDSGLHIKDEHTASPSPVELRGTSSISFHGTEEVSFGRTSQDFSVGRLPDALFIEMIKPDVPAPMSLLPSRNHDSYELFSYYLSRTANSMGNGTTEVNPFIAKLVPLAFSSPLLLQLILAQSAAHRHSSDEPMINKELAQIYYTDSLTMFSHVVGEHVAGRHGDSLILTVGSLIMCLTEVARGDKCGSTFGHITASRSLLTTLLRSSGLELGDDLADFLIEYYVHMASASIISTSHQGMVEQPVLSPEIEASARGLLGKKYVGQLCGSWLSLLLLIPQICALGQKILSNANGHLNVPSPDDIIHFGLLQSDVLAFLPDPSVGPDTYLAGLVFKQAVLLYLWSILGTPHQNTASDSHKELMEAAVSEALLLLDQFPASARVNTSLCWPLAVIGCCIAGPAVRDVVRRRLEMMSATIGLGNMRETLVLLEHAWKQPVQELSPWRLGHLMQEHQTWISFA